jgi:hypothetical protein
MGNTLVRQSCADAIDGGGLNQLGLQYWNALVTTLRHW